MSELVNWWDLPDGTLVRDSKGELRRVSHVVHGKNHNVYLERFSDEYASVYIVSSSYPWAETQKLQHDNNDGDDKPVTVVNIT